MLEQICDLEQLGLGRDDAVAQQQAATPEPSVADHRPADRIAEALGEKARTVTIRTRERRAEQGLHLVPFGKWGSHGSVTIAHGGNSAVTLAARRGVTDMTSAAPTRADSATPEELHPRHVAIRVAEITAVIAVVVIAVAALPGLDEVRDRFGHANVVWVVALVLAEIGSCIGYLLAFRSTFCPQMSWRLSWDIAMSEQAANSLLPAGGAGGLALGVWALRQAGMPVGHIGRRTVAFFVVTSAANFITLVVVGIAVFVGVLPGHGSVWLTLVPALITALGVALGVLSPRLLRALGTRGSVRLTRVPARAPAACQLAPARERHGAEAADGRGRRRRAGDHAVCGHPAGWARPSARSPTWVSTSSRWGSPSPPSDPFPRSASSSSAT